MTLGQRREKYLVAAERIFRRREHYACFALAQGGITFSMPVFLNMWPEFKLFRPATLKNDWDCWWAEDEDGRNARILALLFAAEMTKDEKQ